MRVTFRALRVVTALVLTVLVSPAVAEAPRWVVYTQPDKLLSVRFPGKPTEADQEAPSPLGPLHFKMASLFDATHAFLAAAITYPVDPAAPFDTRKALDGARDQMIANIKGKLTAEKPRKLDGLNGREVWFEAPGPDNHPIHAIARIYVSAKPARAYMVIAMRMTDQPDPDAAKFLDSMHLGKKVELQR